jgi:hypothetical protein
VAPGSAVRPAGDYYANRTIGDLLDELVSEVDSAGRHLQRVAGYYVARSASPAWPRVCLLAKVGPPAPWAPETA